MSLLQQLQSRRSGVLFLGYSLVSRGRTHEDLVTLCIQLVVDSLKHLRKCECLTENRSVRVVKEAESGFDSLFLHKMTKQLGEVEKALGVSRPVNWSCPWRPSRRDEPFFSNVPTLSRVECNAALCTRVATRKIDSPRP